MTPAFRWIASLIIIASICGILFVVGYSTWREKHPAPVAAPTPPPPPPDFRYLREYNDQNTQDGMWKVDIIHDDKRNVTCYVFTHGISCLPDRELGNGRHLDE